MEGAGELKEWYSVGIVIDSIPNEGRYHTLFTSLYIPLIQKLFLPSPVVKVTCIPGKWFY